LGGVGGWEGGGGGGVRYVCVVETVCVSMIVWVNES